MGKNSWIIILLLHIIVVFTTIGNSFGTETVNHSNHAHNKSHTSNLGGKLPKIIVIGAGVAGLNVATKLHDTGNYKVELFEASERIGGRVLTQRLGGGYIELGAQWIHGQKGNSIYELVEPLGLIIHGFDSPKDFALQNGDVLNATTAARIIEALKVVDEETTDMAEDEEEQQEDVVEEEDEESAGTLGEEEEYHLLSNAEAGRIAFDKFLTKHPIHESPSITEGVFDWITQFLIGDSGADNWSIQSNAEEGEQFIQCEGEQSIGWKSPYSFSYLLPLIMSGRVTDEIDLPHWIKLNQTITKILYSTNNHLVQVISSDGKQHYADHVIFTPSLGVLKALHKKIFQPKLSKPKNNAIKYIGFGAAIKIFLEFEKPWWPEQFNGVNPIWEHENNPELDYGRINITAKELMKEHDGVPLWIRSIMMMARIDSRSHPNMFELWSTGESARLIETLDRVYLQKELMKLMRRFLGKRFEIPEPIELHVSNWFSNPFTRGTYSYRSMDSEYQNVWARDLAEPILNRKTKKPLICFAGEATHPHYFSTVHGAYDTGTREFTRIQEFYRKKAELRHSMMVNH